MELTLKLATVQDIPVLLPFIRAYHHYEQIPFDPDLVTATLTPLLTTNTVGYVWLIVLSDEPIGYIVLCFSYSIESLGRDALIDELFIVEQHRGRGFGKQVLEQVMTKARTEGVKVLYLEVARDNVRGQGLYRAVGFEPRDRFFLMAADL